MRLESRAPHSAYSPWSRSRSQPANRSADLGSAPTGGTVGVHRSAGCGGANLRVEALGSGALFPRVADFSAYCALMSGPSLAVLLLVGHWPGLQAG